ncbi:DUF5131 family protein [Streptomyces coeruleorubidus]|uniref:DUF5131 family protein n=1 Tax=Streptomyces coeruleorubidus TaxID=116188 RepID=UPI0037AEB6DE
MPVLEEQDGEEEWPYVWWVPGGLLGMLPIHAAGYHTDSVDDSHRRTVMDRVVSSSVESAKELPRVDDLRQVPAAVRFLSCEPLLGPLDGLELSRIDWVIAGGESGPGHRPMDEAWVTQIRDTCQQAQVAFFFKLLCTIPVTNVRSRSDSGLPARFASRQRSRRWRGGLVGHVDSRTPGDQFGRLVGSVGRFGQVTFPKEGEGRAHPLDSDGETRSGAGTMAVGRQTCAM